ncbi:MAG: DUF1501 domain-containing protein [Planctomycetales bacterium]
MLTIFGRGQGGFCDGVSRRDFLKVGSLGFGGMTLAQLLAAEAQAGQSSQHKAIINIYMPGGPSHIDLWDLKPEAPTEIRGEFKPIQTNVSGIEICEMFPRIAGMMDKFVPIRSMADCNGRHDAYQCMTGRSYPGEGRPHWPSAGAWVSRLAGPVNQGVPPHMSLVYKTGHGPWGAPGGSGFLGMKHAPFRLVGGQGDNSVESAENMVLKAITLDRLRDRKALMQSLDRFRRDADASGKMGAMDVYHQQAMGILTSSKLSDALDVSNEDPKIVERYGKGDPTFRADGAPKVTENFLVARRLVEAGARYVSLNFSRWDWHSENFKRGREDFPMLDAALSALVEDLDQRGMLDDVSIVCWGEFGRTPKNNAKSGRDHWPKVSGAILAGGGMQTGQVIGSTNRLGEEPKDRPVKFQEVFATLFHNMGLLGPRADRIFDFQSRPQNPIESSVAPMRELV